MLKQLFASRRSKAITVTVAVLLLLCFGWLFRVSLLQGAARLWIISDEPVQADAIVILGGGINTRPVAAAQLYHAGWSKQILLMQPERSTIVKLGLVMDYGTITRKILEAENVPESAIALIEPEVTSTFEEAEALHDWVIQHQAKRLLIVTDIFHTRRARWILNRKLNETGVELRMMATPLLYYDSSNWWQDEDGLIDFQNEIIKFAVYRWRY